MKTRLIMLAVLLLALGGALALRYVSLPEPPSVRIDAEQIAKSLEKTQQEYSREARLSDGSFNPLPPEKRSPEADPATLVAKDDWRARYHPLLAAQATTTGTPAFYVYPFLDRTPDGVGLHCTTGWHLVGAAALAQWTDVPLAGQHAPFRYGLPAPAENGPLAIPTTADWAKTALADPDTTGARYLVVGAYDFDSSRSLTTLKINLIDRQAPEREVVLYEDTLTSPVSFGKLSAQQRTAARAVADKLVALNLAHTRQPPEGGRLDLNAELRAVAALLDASDSWAAMDGVDRALALARLFPGETTPLQAASYGLTQLGWMMFGYVTESEYEMDYDLRAYALAQIAMAMDPKPALTRLCWLTPCVMMGHIADQRAADLPFHFGNMPSELDAFHGVTFRKPLGGFTPAQLARVPDWLVLHRERWNSWFVSTPNELRDYFYQRAEHWRDHDLYLQGVAQMFVNNYDIDKRRSTFQGITYGASLATQGSVAAEAAALLASLKGNPAAQALAGKLAQNYAVSADELTSRSAAGDYYGLRKAILRALAHWDAPDDENHPAVALLYQLTAPAESMLQDAAQARPASGFAGFEFTPAERVRLAQRHDWLGFHVIANLEGQKRGYYQGFMKMANAYRQVRPDNVTALGQIVTVAGNRLDQPGAQELRQEAMRQQLATCPLAYEAYFYLGRSHFDTDHPEVGRRLAAQYYRIDPFYYGRDRQMGELCRRYGMHAQAVEYLGRYLQSAPQRYDIANLRAWSLCQMGQWARPEVRQTFALPAPRLPGNPTFHRDNLDFLYYWAKDYAAARQAAAFFRQNDYTGAALAWQARIEAADGQTSKALEILAQADPGQARSLSRATFHAAIAQAYLDLNRPDLAEPHVTACNEIDSGYNGSILTAAGLAFAQGKYQEAMEYYQGSINRYGSGYDESITGLADCLEKLGKTGEAIALLEKLVFTKQISAARTGFAPRLMEYYARTLDRKKADPLLELVLKAGQHTRREVNDTLMHYKKINPGRADQLQRQVDAIMAGPSLEAFKL